MNKTINFYTTLGCHLCDDALKLINDYNANVSLVDVVEIEITESDILVERYGIRIPVIKSPDSDSELGWPFNASMLKTFLEKT